MEFIHQDLLSNYKWYSSWHSHKHHVKFHWMTLAVTLFVAGSSIFTAFSTQNSAITEAASNVPNYVTITDQTGSTQTNRVVTISRVFAQGDIANFPQAKVNGVATLTQADVKNRWPDGSVKHSLVSFITSIPAGGNITVDFVNQSTGNNNGFLDKAGMLAYKGGTWSAQIQTSIGSADAKTMLSNWNGVDTGVNGRGVRYWMKGPIVTQVIVEDADPTLQYDFGSDANKSLHPRFFLTFYPGSNAGVKVDYILEDVWSNKRQDQTYDLTLKAGGNTVYSKSGLTQYARTRWRKTFWSGTQEGKINVNHNLAYMTASKAIPNFDLSKTSSANGSSYTKNYDINQNGQIMKSFGTTGGRPEIGMFPLWTMEYLYTFNPGMLDVMLGNAEVSSWIPVHTRVGDTGLAFCPKSQECINKGLSSVSAFGREISIDALPTTVNVGTIGAHGWTVDTAHQGSFNYVPYIVTGDPYYLEEMHSWASRDLAVINPCSDRFYCRHDDWGYLWEQLRGMAWGLRNIAHAGFISPDGTPEKSYYDQKILNNIAIREGMQDVKTGYGYTQDRTKWDWGYSTAASYKDVANPNYHMPNPLHYPGKDNVGTSMEGMDLTKVYEQSPPWQNSMLISVIGHITTDLGYPGQGLLQAFAEFHINQLTNPAFNPWLISTYRSPGTTQGARTFFTDWSQVKAAYLSNFQTVSGLVSGITSTDYMMYARAAVSYLTPFTATAIPGGQQLSGQAAWNWMSTNAPSDLQRGILPRTVGQVIPPPPVTDTLAPSVPTGLSIQAISGTQLNLSWTASTDNTGVVGYKIYRASPGVPLAQVGTVTTNSYQNTGLTALTSYSYAVAAYDAAGNTSGQSLAVSANTLQSTAAVPVISSFTASPTSITSGQVSTLSWSVTGATSLSISGLGTVTGTSKAVSPTQTTSYTLTATNASGNVTKQVSVTVGAVVPPTSSLYNLEFSTYFGGSGDDFIRDVVTDGQGNIYITGGESSSNFPATPGTYDTTPNGNMDVFVAKFSPSGVLLWSTLIGGSNYDRAYAIEVDGTGVYVGGRAGQGFPMKNAAQSTFAGDNAPNGLYGQQDGFISKLSLDGQQLLWSTYVGDNGLAFLRDIALDGVGGVYGILTGVKGSVGLVSTGSYDTTLNGGEDGAIIKLTTNGSSVWGTYLGGSGLDVGTPSIRANNSGVYVLGFTNSTNMPVTSGLDTTYGGGGDMHLAKLSTDGKQLLWGTYFGGSASEFSETHGLTLDSSGNPIVAVTTGSTGLATVGAYDTTFNGAGGSGTGAGTNYAGDGVIAKFNSNGALQAATYFGGTAGEGVEGVSTDANGNIYIGGATFSVLPLVGGSYQTTNRGAGDFFAAKFNPDLSTLLYSTYMGGSSEDFGRTLFADNSGYIYSGGHSTSNNFSLKNAYDSTIGGGDEGVLVKFSPSGSIPPPPPPPVTDTTAPSVPAGLSISVVSTTQLNLSWNASTDNTGVLGYKVFRNGTQIATSPTASYSNTGLTPATQYSYAVSAYDAAGNTSGQSIAVSASTVLSTVKPTISSFTASPTSITSGQVSTLSWSVTGATSLSVSGVGTVTGTSVTVSPTQNTTYTLTATNATGNTTKQVTVSVGAVVPPPVDSTNISNVQAIGDFSQTNNCSTLNLDQSCSISVVFKPTTSGTRSGTLSFKDSKSGVTHNISLTGVGVSVTPPPATDTPLPPPPPTPEPTAETTVSNGLVVHLKLNEKSGTTASDSVDGNSGTLVNGPTWTTGKIGGALALNGTNQYVTVPNSTASQFTNALTMSVWVYQTSLNQNATIAGKWAGGSQQSWLVRVRDGAVRVNIAPTLADNYTTYVETPANSFSAGSWHHVVFVYNGSDNNNPDKVKVYIDGSSKTLTFTGTIPSTLLNANAPLDISRGNGYWNGNVDDFRVYNRVLSSSEISSIYAAGNKGLASSDRQINIVSQVANAESAQSSSFIDKIFNFFRALARIPARIARIIMGDTESYTAAVIYSSNSLDFGSVNVGSQSSAKGINVTYTSSTTPPPPPPPPPPVASCSIPLPASSESLNPGMESPRIVTAQKVLNSNSATIIATRGDGSPGNETNYYGNKMTSAVKKFQCLYNIVCSGNTSSSGYGAIGPKTLQKMREIQCQKKIDGSL